MVIKSRKTFTMMGADSKNLANTPEATQGICPRTINSLYEAIEKESVRFAFQVTANMIEVYC